MSFSMQAAGKIADVIEQIKAHEFAGDTSQADTIKQLLLDELQEWGDGGMRGVFVEASGYHHAGSRSLNTVMRPLYLKG